MPAPIVAIWGLGRAKLRGISRHMKRATLSDRKTLVKKASKKTLGGDSKRDAPAPKTSQQHERDFNQLLDDAILGVDRARKKGG